MTSRALLVAWHARALYLGPSWALSAHRNAAAVLAVAVQGRLGVARDPRRPGRGWHDCRTALIEPDRLHRLDTGSGQFAFLYLDGLSGDLPLLRPRFSRRGVGVSFDLNGEDALIDLLAAAPHSAAGWQWLRPRLQGLLRLAEPSADPRVQAACQRLLAAGGTTVPVNRLAAAVGLSPSRLQHLFRQHTGVSVRRYRLWLRMRTALAAAVAGHTLTDAALAAGFAGSAHFSAAFREMFGMAPRQLMGAAPVWVEDDKVAMGASLCRAAQGSSQGL
ncbi:MAG: helix-turn-helix transcriptional regulator [Betaproteobacteria bacterium]